MADSTHFKPSSFRPEQNAHHGLLPRIILERMRTSHASKAPLECMTSYEARYPTSPSIKWSALQPLTSPTHVTRHTSRVTSHTLHFMGHMSHITLHGSRVTRYTHGATGSSSSSSPSSSSTARTRNCSHKVISRGTQRLPTRTTPCISPHKAATSKHSHSPLQPRPPLSRSRWGSALRPR
jgi:hypothetical protein